MNAARLFSASAKVGEGGNDALRNPFIQINATFKAVVSFFQTQTAVLNTRQALHLCLVRNRSCEFVFEVCIALIVSLLQCLFHKPLVFFPH